MNRKKNALQALLVLFGTVLALTTTSCSTLEEEAGRLQTITAPQKEAIQDTVREASDRAAAAATLTAPRQTPTAGSPGAGRDGAEAHRPQPQATLLLFADFRCPHCARFAASYSGRIISAMAPAIETGAFAFEYRHFPILGEPSHYLAQVGECANVQGRFQGFHDDLYHHQYRALSDRRLRPVDGPGPGLDRLLETSQVDTTLLRECIDSGHGRRIVSRHTEEARRLGVNGTPTLVLNGQIISWSSLQEILNQVRAAL